MISWQGLGKVDLSFIQIEDLSQQAQMQAAENFKRQENPAGFGEVPSTLQQPIQEESEDEEEVGTSQCNSYS